MTDADNRPAVVGQVERGVGRPVPERASACGLTECRNKPMCVRCARQAEMTTKDSAADLRDDISFPPLPPSPVEVGDLILQMREYVQSLGWSNREQLYTASQVRALLSECAVMVASRERQRIVGDVAGLHMAQSVNHQNHPNAWHDGVDAALDVIRAA